MIMSPTTMVVGRCGNLAFTILCAISLFLLPASSTLENLIMLICFLTGYCGFLLVLRVLKDQLTVLLSNVALHVFFAALSLPFWALLISSATIPSAFFFLFSIFLGISSSFDGVLWGTLWGDFYSNDPYLEKFYCQTGASCILGAGMLFLIPASEALTILLPTAFLLTKIVPVVIGFLIYGSISEKISSITWKQSQEKEISRTPVWPRTYIYGFSTVAFLLTTAFRFNFDPIPMAISVLGGLFFSSLLLLGISYLKKVIPDLVRFDSIVFSAAEIIILVGFALPNPHLILSSTAGCTALLCYGNMYDCAMWLSSGKNGISPLFHHVIRHYRPALGALLGAAFTCTAFFLFPDYAVQISSVTIIALLILGNMGAPYIQNDWDALYKHANMIEEGIPIEQMQEPSQYAVVFTDVCGYIAEKHRLTVRELDVLQFLAKGRNASAIAERLYITPNTVRSHIYRIYKKMGVESQQELINLVDRECQAKRNSLLGEESSKKPLHRHRTR